MIKSKQKFKFSKQEEELVVNKSHAVILHPSFGCPVIAEPGKPISIFLLTDDDFFDIFTTDAHSSPTPSKSGSDIPSAALCTPTEGCMGGGIIKRHINQMLKFTPWSEQKKLLTSPEEFLKPLFQSEIKKTNSDDANTKEEDSDSSSSDDNKEQASADKSDSEKHTAENSIEVTFIGDLTNPTGIKDKNGNVFANIRPAVFNRFKEKCNMKYLFQVDISNLTAKDKENLYEFTWITFNDEPFNTPADDKFIDDDLNKQKYYSIQDQDSRNFIIDTPDQETRKYFTHAYKVGDTKKPTESSGDDNNKKEEKAVDDFKFEFEFDPEVPIINHHPVWFAPAEKKRLNIGHLSDPHISVRQHAFQTCKAQVIPGASEEEFPKIGNMVNVSFYTFKNLMDQLGNDDDIDVLIITGDIVDNDLSYNPKNMFFSGKKATTGDIWDQMNLKHIGKKFDDGTEMYPTSIDSVVAYSLFHRFCTVYNKPIFVVSGNHEAYRLPWGISPRMKTGRTLKNTAQDAAAHSRLGSILNSEIGSTLLLSPLPLGAVAKHFLRDWLTIKSEDQVLADTKNNQKNDWDDKINTGKDGFIDAKKANDGIPMDHNLTFYEAILMYGPDYSALPGAGTGQDSSYTNFIPETMEWFYQIFTPFTDFYFNFKDQTFIGLEWGNDEHVLINSTDAQLDATDANFYLIGGALPRANTSISGIQKKIIDNAMDEENSCNIMMSHFTYTAYFPEKPHSEIGITNIIGKHEFGTFEENKDYVYNDLIKNHKIHYTLSGHTHRAGLYQLNEGSGKSGWLTNIHNAYSKGCGFGLFTPNSKLYVKAIDWNIPTKEDLIYSEFESEKTKMLVSGCSGPTGVINYDNELFTKGRDFPSGAYIKFNSKDDKQENIGVVRATNPSAKPRFAVALDFADIVGCKTIKKDNGIFKSIIMPKDFSKIEVNIDPDLTTPLDEGAFIIELKLIFVKKNKIQNTLNFLPSKQNITSVSNTIVLEPSDKMSEEDLAAIFDMKTARQKEGEGETYLSMKFSPIQDKRFAHYDYSTPFTIRAELLSLTGVFKELYEDINNHPHKIKNKLTILKQFKEYIDDAGGYIIKRDTKQGEVVNHFKLSESENDDFEFDSDSNPENNPNK